MVSAANIWLAGILNCLVSSYHTQERFSSFKTCFTTTSDFWILSSYSLILWKKPFVFPRRVTLGTRIFICSNYYSLKFRMCVGSKIPISHSHKQMMPRLLPRAAAAGKQNWNVNESTQKSRPADGSSSRVQQSTEWLSNEEATSWQVKIKRATCLSTIHTHTHQNNPQNKSNPRQPSKVKLSPGWQSRRGQRQHEAAPPRALEERKHLPGHFSLPVLSSQKGSGSQALPHEKESGAESTPQRFSKQTLVAAGPGSEKGRNLHIKMYLKSESKNGFKFQYSN